MWITHEMQQGFPELISTPWSGERFEMGSRSTRMWTSDPPTPLGVDGERELISINMMKGLGLGTSLQPNGRWIQRSVSESGGRRARLSLSVNEVVYRKRFQRPSLMSEGARVFLKGRFDPWEGDGNGRPEVWTSSSIRSVAVIRPQGIKKTGNA
jgi:hypothetical protein